MAPIPSFTDAAKAIAKDFEYSDDDVRKSVKHFLDQMRMLKLRAKKKKHSTTTDMHHRRGSPARWKVHVANPYLRDRCPRWN